METITEDLRSCGPISFEDIMNSAWVAGIEEALPWSSSLIEWQLRDIRTKIPPCNTEKWMVRAAGWERTLSLRSDQITRHLHIYLIVRGMGGGEKKTPANLNDLKLRYSLSISSFCTFIMTLMHGLRALYNSLSYYKVFLIFWTTFFIIYKL